MTQITNNTGNDVGPQITPDGQIYWQGWDGSDNEIFRYTISTGVTENLTNNSVDDINPAVNSSAGLLVWSHWDGQDYEIYRYYLGIGITRLTDDNHDDSIAPR